MHSQCRGVLCFRWMSDWIHKYFRCGNLRWLSCSPPPEPPELVGFSTRTILIISKNRFVCLCTLPGSLCVVGLVFFGEAPAIIHILHVQIYMTNFVFTMINYPHCLERRGHQGRFFRAVFKCPQSHSPKVSFLKIIMINWYRRKAESWVRLLKGPPTKKKSTRGVEI